MRVSYTKWGGRPHWRFDGERLGRDRHGLWLGMRRDTVIRRGEEPGFTQPHDCVMLVPDTGCYTAFWNASGSVAIYVDVTTRPVVGDSVVEAVDLDLDVLRMAGGEVKIVDEDEFDLHREQLGYPAWLVEQARSTAGWLLTEISAGTEPFGDAGPAWLAGFERSG